MTVIVSIFLWGLIIGGVIGPLLAVPLTATIKVLLARYACGRRAGEGRAGSNANRDRTRNVGTNQTPPARKSSPVVSRTGVLFSTATLAGSPRRNGCLSSSRSFGRRSLVQLQLKII